MFDCRMTLYAHKTTDHHLSHHEYKQEQVVMTTQ
jgi:hypothetical protein